MFGQLKKFSVFNFGTTNKFNIMNGSLQRWIQIKDYQSIKYNLYELLFVQKLYPKISHQYYNLLLIYSKSCFHLRKYDESEIALENCIFILDILQEIEVDEKEILIQLKDEMTYIKFYMKRKVFSNQAEYEYNTLQQPQIYKDFQKKHLLNLQFQQAQAASESLIKCQEEYQIKEIGTEIQYVCIQCLSVFNYILDKNQSAIQYALNALNILNPALNYIKKEDLMQLQAQDIPDIQQAFNTILFLAEILIADKHESSKNVSQLIQFKKIALYILKILQDTESELLNIFRPKIDLLYCAYFYDHNLFDETLKLSRKIIRSDTHPVLYLILFIYLKIFDFIKIQASHIAQNVEKKKADTQRKSNLIFEEQIQELQKSLNIPENSQHFSNLSTPLIDFFELHQDDLYEIEV